MGRHEDKDPIKRLEDKIDFIMDRLCLIGQGGHGWRLGGWNSYWEGKEGWHPRNPWRMKGPETSRWTAAEWDEWLDGLRRQDPPTPQQNEQ